jgi:hypothetical protein
MRLKVPKIEGHSLMAGGRDDIVDLDSGRTVGFIRTRQGPGTRCCPSRDISLYGKYKGSFETHNECVAFAKGVEAVLNHMVSPADKPSDKEAAATTAA